MLARCTHFHVLELYRCCFPISSAAWQQLTNIIHALQAGRLPRISESTEALLPTVCAMALLPGGLMGPAYAPTALRHLMTDPDSPVADLYQDCPHCVSLSQDRSRCNLESTEVSNIILCTSFTVCVTPVDTHEGTEGELSHHSHTAGLSTLLFVTR